MSRSKPYQTLLNDKRWHEVKRIVWQRTNGLCERCKEEGFITPGVDCHHIVPVESGRTLQEMARLCYDVNNVRLLCIPCHIKTHQEMLSHTKEKVAENKARARRRFMEANDPNYKQEDNEHDNGRVEGAAEAARQPVNEEPRNGEAGATDHPQSAERSEERSR